MAGGGGQNTEIPKDSKPILSPQVTNIKAQGQRALASHPGYVFPGHPTLIGSNAKGNGRNPAFPENAVKMNLIDKKENHETTLINTKQIVFFVLIRVISWFQFYRCEYKLYVRSSHN
jgi:hypothetical protein